MAFTFIRSNDFQDSPSDVTIAVTLTGVTAGNLIVVFASHQGVSSTTITVSDGTSSLVTDTINDGAPGPHGMFAYLLSANGGTVTYTATYAAAEAFRKIQAWEFSHTAAVTFDTSNATAFATSASLTTGAVTTASTDELVLAGAHVGGGKDFTAMQINGVNADGSLNTAGSGSAVWYRILTSTFGAGTATAALSGGGEAWVGNLIAFKGATGPAGGAFTQAILRSRLREW